MKVLALDVETAPHLVTAWGLFDQRIGLNQILTPGYTMCWAAKWIGDNHVYFDSIHRNTEEGMIRNIHDMLSEADVVLSYNGNKFDLPTLNKEFVKFGLPPPAPYQQIDLLKTTRRQFKLASNKLDYVCQFLGLGSKTQHKGHELWLGCMNGDKDAWKTMEEYNCQDVLLLEALYEKLKPWVKSPPNRSLYSGALVCPSCGGTNYRMEGKAYLASGVYQRYSCSCGHWFRDTKSTASKDKFLSVT